MGTRTVTVTLVRTPRPFYRRGARWQPWRWIAKAENGRIVATSGESYTNQADCLAAINLVFGAGTSASLANVPGHPSGTRRLLRSAVWS